MLFAEKYVTISDSLTHLQKQVHYVNCVMKMQEYPRSYGNCSLRHTTAW